MITALFLIIAIAVVAGIHKAVMSAVTGYDGYGSHNDHVRRIDHIYFELHSREQLERAS